MKTPQERQNEWTTYASLEAELRSLPPPPVPAGLEERLLTTIPSRPTVITRPHRFRWKRVAGGIGIAAAAILLLTFPRGEAPPAQGSMLPGALGNTSPEYVLGDAYYDYLKETSPCYILPPI
jgi:hypothetical protein